MKENERKMLLYNSHKNVNKCEWGADYQQQHQDLSSLDPSSPLSRQQIMWPHHPVNMSVVSVSGYFKLLYGIIYGVSPILMVLAK